jgi:hypothetical protein
MTDALLPSLVGRELASVTFVRDYLQLDFDGPRLSVFTWPEVTRGARSQSISNPDYRNSLCSLIGHPVRAVTEDSETGLAIRFEPGSVVIKPSPSEVEGPEIALLNTDADDTGWMVWRPGEYPFDGPQWT